MFLNNILFAGNLVAVANEFISDKMKPYKSILREVKAMKTGLVLEGGGTRGIYTAGILDVFLEYGIEFDGVIGVSAGAIHGVSFVSKQKGRSIRYYKKYCNDPRFMGVRSWIKTGDFIGVDFCYHELPEKLDIYDNETFMASASISTGLEKYGNDAEARR